MSVHDLLVQLQASALGDWIRDSGPWTYALVNLTHVIGVALLFGAVAILDLALLGAWGRRALAEIARPASTVAAVGLGLALLTGPALLSAQAEEYEGNPFLAIKLVAVALGAANLAALHLSAAWKARDAPASRRRLAIGGAISLACWLTALTCGRLIAFW